MQPHNYYLLCRVIARGASYYTLVIVSAMAYYDSDDSDDPWDGHDDPNDDYWYNQYDHYDQYDNYDQYDDYDDYDNYDDYDDYEEDDYDDCDDEEEGENVHNDPWDNTLSEQEEDNIIARTIKIHKINVKKYDHQKLKHFTVRGEGLFECGACDNRWTSHNATIKVDLYKKCIARKFTQRCKLCPTQWLTPSFTDDRFEEIMEKVAEKYEKRMVEDDENEQPVFIIADSNGKPHLQKYCEKCQELGKPCWKYVVDAAR